MHFPARKYQNGGTAAHFMTFVAMLIVVKLLSAEQMMNQLWFVFGVDTLSYIAAILALRATGEKPSLKYAVPVWLAILAFSSRPLSKEYFSSFLGGVKKLALASIARSGQCK